MNLTADNTLLNVSDDLLNKHKSLKVIYNKITDLKIKLDNSRDEVENKLMIIELSSLKTTFNELLRLYDDTKNDVLLTEYNKLKYSYDNILLSNDKLKNENKNLIENYENLLNVNVNYDKKHKEYENNNNKLLIKYNELLDEFNDLINENRKNKKYYEEQIFNVKTDFKSKIKEIRIDNQKLIEKNKELYKLKYQKIIADNEIKNKMFIDKLKNSTNYDADNEINCIVEKCNYKITAYLIVIFILTISNIYFVIKK